MHTYLIKKYFRALGMCGLASLGSMGISHAQAPDTSGMAPVEHRDTTLVGNPLATVVVSAFEQTRKLSDQPAPVAYLSGAALGRYGVTGILSAMNAVPGVRMEQRSPGSYRLNIRGSSLRSPFGVRNVKVYYNGMPLTEPGGNTYLNQLSFSDYGSLEIIKGPAGSIYGAGTGGVVLIHSPLYNDTAKGSKAVVNLDGGSYGLRKIGASVRWGGNGAASELRYTDLKTDGYRDHTALHSRIASFETRLQKNDRGQLDAFFHYTDLFYETPGGLTFSQYEADPKSARPAAGPFPSADQNKAAVYQKAFFMGLKRSYRFSSHLENTTVLYGSYTDFTNPTIFNYEYRKEPHFGGRTVFQYHYHGPKTRTRLWLGAEVRQGFFSVKDLQNMQGSPGAPMTDDRIDDLTALLFAQAELSFTHGWDLTGGVSANHEDLRFTRLYPVQARPFHKTYPVVLSPRIALSKKLTPAILLYADVSRGFSPPSVAELLPSTTVLNKHLQAEQGINYEVGSKGRLVGGRLYYDVSAFVFHLTQSISQRRDSSGADYFVNAGSALHKGLEAAFTYRLYQNGHAFISRADAWGSGSLMDFRYEDYRVADKDYSHQKIPGTAPFTAAAGVDIDTRLRLQAHLTWQHTASIPLNDGNSVSASPYDLLGCRLSYGGKLAKKTDFVLSAGGDNLLGETYSLGDDVNASGGRYYNVAPGINFYTNLQIRFLF